MLPDFALAGTFLATWIAPYTFGEKFVSHLLLLMLLEFINVHSSAFMGHVLMAPQPREKKAAALLRLGCFYSLFIGAFALSFHVVWPLIAFWGLTFNRLAGALFGAAPDGLEKEYIQYGWGMSVMFYVLGATLTLFLPLPALGVTRDVIVAQEFTSTGAWISQPWRVMAFGAFYFAAMGWAELRTPGWVARQKGESSPLMNRRAMRERRRARRSRGGGTPRSSPAV